MKLPDYTNTSLFHSFAWNSLTTQQKFRIVVKYELAIKLDERGSESKRSIYRAIADKFNYTMSTIEKIANTELK